MPVIRRLWSRLGALVLFGLGVWCGYSFGWAGAWAEIGHNHGLRDGQVVVRYTGERVEVLGDDAQVARLRHDAALLRATRAALMGDRRFLEGLHDQADACRALRDAVLWRNGP